MGPKPVYTLWPYGQAGDSAGRDQRVDRLRHDGQTLYTQNIKAVGVDVLVTAVVEGFLIVIYQKALDNSGYKHLLTFSSNIPTQTSNSKRKIRKRDIIWYNPPFSKNISTNIGRTFPKLLDAEFTEEHVLHKIFNRNTIKISYSCMPNLKQNIDSHNKSILHKKIVPPRSCNCRVETASRNRLFIKRLSRQKITTLPRPTWD